MCAVPARFEAVADRVLLAELRKETTTSSLSHQMVPAFALQFEACADLYCNRSTFQLGSFLGRRSRTWPSSAARHAPLRPVASSSTFPYSFRTLPRPSSLPRLCTWPTYRPSARPTSKSREAHARAISWRRQRCISGGREDKGQVCIRHHGWRMAQWCVGCRHRRRRRFSGGPAGDSP